MIKEELERWKASLSPVDRVTIALRENVRQYRRENRLIERQVRPPE